MKYFPLIWATLWRKKTRTILTLLAIAIAFLLFGLLETVDYAFSHPAGMQGANKLITTNKYSLTFPLPYSALQQVRSVPGIEDVTLQVWFGGYYQESKNFIFALPVETDSYFNIHRDDMVVTPDALAAFQASRTGALVGVETMKKYNWKVGDKIPLHSTIWTQKDGSLDWTFDIVGTFDAKDPEQRATYASPLVFHYEYFDEGRSFGNHSIGWMEELVKNPGESAEVGAKIDALFANSSNETKTVTAKEFTMAFIKQIGDIGFILRTILGAVFFALLFLTGNTMMQSVRERIPELAVLKTLGFSDGKVLGFVLAEALLLCVMSALIGLGLSFALLPLLKKGLQGLEASPTAMLPGLGVAVLLALLVGLPPALRARRLNIVDALAGRH